MTETTVGCGQLETLAEHPENVPITRFVSSLSVSIVRVSKLFLLQLATLAEHPESVPINALVAVAGTPLEGREPVSGLELARVIATSRLTMPRSVVRLSAGRLNFSFADQVRSQIRRGFRSVGFRVRSS